MSGTCSTSSSGGCGCTGNVSFDGASAEYRRRLWLVIAINGLMFFVEIIGGAFAGSRALQADALDFLGDTLTYGISLAVIGMSLRVRATAALAKGISLFLMGLWVAGSTIWSFFILRTPEAPVMSAIAFLALAANVASVLLLKAYKDGDANVRSVWLCSRNDAIGNMAVIAAAALVWITSSPWPDLIVAIGMAFLFTSSAMKILRQGWAEYRSTHAPHDSQRDKAHEASRACSEEKCCSADGGSCREDEEST